MILSEQINESLKTILSSIIKKELLNERTLAEIYTDYKEQRNRRFTPQFARDNKGKKIDGLAPTSRRTQGFWNFGKHIDEMWKAGIKPEFQGCIIDRNGMIQAFFLTKSSEYVFGKGKKENKDYVQKLIFTDWPTIKDNINLNFSEKLTETFKGNIEQKCNCNSDRYHYGYVKHVKDADKHLEPKEIEIRPAPERNPPPEVGIGCKHLGLLFYNEEFIQYWGNILLKELDELIHGKESSKVPSPPTSPSSSPLPSASSSPSAQLPSVAQPLTPRPRGKEQQSPSRPKGDTQHPPLPRKLSPYDVPLPKNPYGQKLISKDDPRLTRRPGYAPREDWMDDEGNILSKQQHLQRVKPALPKQIRIRK